MIQRISLFVCFLLVLVLTTGFRALPGGVGEARFGMSVAEVKKLFPTMAQEKSEGQPYRVTNQQYEKLKNCTLDFYFYKDRLMQVAVYYNDNTQSAVEKFLKKQYGPPTQEKPIPTWQGEKTQMILKPDAGLFVLQDKSLLREMAQAVFGKPKVQVHPPKVSPPQVQPPKVQPPGDDAQGK